jgi:4-hydroxybenzoyl-CoA thioesterase/acyl-CoA thioester hydrolase
MPATFCTSRMVEFSDTDMAGIVHFSRFFCFMERAEHELLRSLGLSVSMEWEGHRISFPRVGASCDFLNPARFEDVLNILVSIENVGRSSVTYGFKFFTGDLPIAVGQLTTVCCRIEEEHQLESIEIPEGIRTKLERAGSSGAAQ